ncbi:MAG: hypothetical protein IJ375_06055 [Oscillospiraceae bacterium]|nr:hypothetical protein [Oscillospiraceae bacterium]
MRLNNKKAMLGFGLRAAVWAAVTVVFLLLFSLSTSPLTNEYGTDSAFFVLVGQGMTQGMLPYRDFFDMKGPYLFLIEYIGQLFRYGRVGAICVQCINLFLTLCIMDLIFLTRLGKGNFPMELLCVAPVLVTAMVTFDGGNLTEEYALPWLMLALLLALGYLKKSRDSGNWAHPKWAGFYYGFAFGFLALIRVTNAAAIGAVILTITVGLLVKKEFKNLLVNGGMFLLGCAAAFAPACIFFACHGLLGEMLTQVFLFGFQYSGDGDLASRLAMIREDYMAFVYLALLPLGVLALYRVKDWRKWLLAASSFAVFLAAVLMGNVYVHYFTLALPNLVLAMAFWLEALGEKAALRRWDLKKALVVALTVLCFLPMGDLLTVQYDTSATVRYWKSIGAGRWKRDYCLDIASWIPEEERGSVYAYGMATYAGGMYSCSNFYVQAQLLPSHRYCDWQEHYIELNPEMGEELAAWLAAENPKWVIVPVEYTIQPEQIAEAINGHYHEHVRNDTYILYAANSKTEK